MEEANNKIDEHREYVGTVINNDDPNHAGRCQVRVGKLMDGMDDKHLPWATPALGHIFAGGEDGGGYGDISIPKKNTVVKVRFKKGEIKAPEYYGIQKMSKDLVNEIKNDYIDSHVLLYDHDQDLSIMYQPNSGIRIYLRGSYIQINPDGMITLNHAGDTSCIQLIGNKLNVTSTNEITINGANTVNVQSKVINLQASESTTIKGDRLNNNPEMAVNGLELYNILLFMAKIIDKKYAPTPFVCEGKLISSKHKLLNSKIKYV